MPITYHVCLDIEGTLKIHGNHLKGMLCVNGVELTGKQVKEFLRKVRSEKGFKYYSGCDKMDEYGRCAGHEVNKNE